MLIIIDACAVINLHNSASLALVAGNLPGITFFVTPEVLSECGPKCVAEVLRLRADGLLTFIDDEAIPVTRFLELITEHDIGDGELECIAVCETGDYVFCSDDAKARKLGNELIGTARVIGSLRLLRWIVENGTIPCTDAFNIFGAMKQSGGFLPSIEQTFFCQGADC